MLGLAGSIKSSYNQNSELLKAYDLHCAFTLRGTHVRLQGPMKEEARNQTETHQQAYQKQEFLELMHAAQHSLDCTALECKRQIVCLNGMH